MRRSGLRQLPFVSPHHQIAATIFSVCTSQKTAQNLNTLLPRSTLFRPVLEVIDPMRTLARITFFATIVFLLTSLLPSASFAQTAGPVVDLNFVPAKTTVNFTLGATLHSVHGSFAMKHGAVHFDPATNKLSGEIVIDATSGDSGNDGRDKKMHADVLESGRYPEIVFRPDRVDGQVAPAGASQVQVHGMFSVHGAEHEITIPVQVEMAARHWTANAHFAIPYVKWGMKNPSTFVLRVDPSVEIEVQASGEIP
jgi:polyisoprenoid-binding protein YceI